MSRRVSTYRTRFIQLTLWVFSVLPAAAGLPADYGRLEALAASAHAAAARAAAASTLPLSDPLSPEQVAGLAATRNPEAAEALERVEKQLVTVRKELGLPDLNVSLEARDFSKLPEFNSMNGNMLALNRTWPLGGKLSRHALAAFHEAEKDFHDYEASLADLLRDARMAAADLYSAQAQAAILEENAALSRELGKIARTRYATGLGAEQDALKAEVEAVGFEREKLEPERMGGVARSAVDALLGRPQQSPVPRAAPPADRSTFPALEELETRAREGRPEVLAARAMLEKAAAEVGVAEAERHRPDLMGQVGVMQDPEGTRTGWDAMVSINLPWFSARRGLAVREAAGGLATQRQHFEAVWNKTRQGVQDALLRAKESAATLELFRKRLVPLAAETLKSSRAGYETSQIDFLSLLDSLRSLNEVSLGQVRTAAELEQRTAELERAVGTRLPARGR